MEKKKTSFGSFFLDLYLKPSLLVLGSYQIVVTGIFTAQQLLLAAYLDQLGLIIVSGFIIAVFFLFWFILGPISGSLSDLYGRKFLLISSNWVSTIGFFGLLLTAEPLILFFFNSILGIGAALRIGSLLALWVQHSPKNRMGESMAYVNILISIGGVGGSLLGLYSWITINKLTFLIFGLAFFIIALPIFFLSDLGEYKKFSVSSIIDSIKNIIVEKSKNRFFFSRPIIQLSIHWIAFSTIVAFTTFIIPIFERITEQLPPDLEFPIPIIIIFVIGLILSLLGGLLIWGRISDKWARKPVLILGFVGAVMLILLFFGLIQFGLLYSFLFGLITGDLTSLVIIMIMLILTFIAVSLIPAPMAWIIDLIGNEDIGKAMSLRQALIGIGTVIGTSTGGFIIGIFGLNGLFLALLLFLMISAIILI